MIKLLCLLLFTSSLFASEVAHYKIRPGKFHKGGKIKISVQETKHHAIVKINYKVKKKAFVPVPRKYLSRVYSRAIPLKLMQERGYDELAKKGVMNLPKARIKYLGRKDYHSYRNCHVIKILPTNGKSELTAFYHPNIPAAGWVYVKIKIKNIRFLKSYTMEAKYRE